MLSFIRDAFTVLVFVGIFGALLVHTIRREFGWIFPAKRVSKSAKPFQGSAAVWVK